MYLYLYIYIYIYTYWPLSTHDPVALLQALVFLDLLMKVGKASSGGALFLAVVPVAVLENWERESWIQLRASGSDCYLLLLGFRLGLLQRRVALRKNHAPGMEELLNQMRQSPVLSQSHPVEGVATHDDCVAQNHPVNSTHRVLRIISPETISYPEWNEVPRDATDADVFNELLAWAHHSSWEWLRPIDFVLIHEHWACSNDPWHYIYIDEADPPFQYTYHDVIDRPRTSIGHLRWLYQQGHHPAVIIDECKADHAQAFIVTCRDPQPTVPCKTATPWPPHQSPIATWSTICRDVELVPERSPSCAWSRGITADKLNSLFQSATDVLSKTFEGLDLPPRVWEALHKCEPLDRLDRLVIYTDGSSLPGFRRCPPLRAELEGHGDTWAFLVLGEQYSDEHASKINVSGWTAQPALYDPAAGHHIKLLDQRPQNERRCFGVVCGD